MTKYLVNRNGRVSWTTTDPSIGLSDASHSFVLLPAVAARTARCLHRSRLAHTRLAAKAPCRSAADFGLKVIHC
eukprot:scaffold232072_cov13-Prasinocladus_malaysianus.AAC.1